MDMEGILAITFIFGGGTLFLLAVSPVGRALAERIRSHGPQQGTDPELLAEVDALRAEVSELHERVDSTGAVVVAPEDPPGPCPKSVTQYHPYCEPATNARPIPIDLKSGKSMSSRWTGELTHASMADCAEDRSVPAARFSPPGDDTPQSGIRTHGLRPRESV